MNAPSFTSIGAFGKIPSQGDFVRVHCLSSAFAAFDAWLHHSLEALQRAHAILPAAAVSFLFRTTGTGEVLLGSLAPSVDSVGRSFPLAVFAALDAAPVAPIYPILPTACGRFLGGAAQLVSGPPTTVADLEARVEMLPVPSPQEFAIAAEMREDTLRGAPAVEFIDRLFSAEPAGRQYYAFRTLVSACEPLCGRPADRPGLTLDCPVSCDLDRLAWLDLCRRLLAWHDAPPSLLWTEPHPSRLLVSLGPTPSSFLVFLAKADLDASSIWPLATERPDAIESARNTLKPAHRHAVESDLPLEALLTALAD